MKIKFPKNVPMQKKAMSIVGPEAYDDFRENYKKRDPSVTPERTEYRRLVRKIWKKVSEASYEYESGVYDPTFFYMVPQVVFNQKYVILPNGRIKDNSATGGDEYALIFCNLLKGLSHQCWSLNGSITRRYGRILKKITDTIAPTYYFILPMLIKNKMK